MRQLLVPQSHLSDNVIARPLTDHNTRYQSEGEDDDEFDDDEEDEDAENGEDGEEEDDKPARKFVLNSRRQILTVTQHPSPRSAR